MIETETRPKTLSEFYNTVDIQPFLNQVQTGNFYNLYIFHGLPGTGKTTMARIMASHILELNDEERELVIYRGSDSGIYNFTEVDFALNNKADDATRVANQIIDAGNSKGTPWEGKYVFILDEFTELENKTQKKLVKVSTDNGKDNVYIFIITNNLDKVEDSILSRSRVIQFNELSTESAKDYIKNLAKKIGAKLTNLQADEVVNNLGQPLTPRNLLVALQTKIDGFQSYTDTEQKSVVKSYVGMIKQVSDKIFSLHIKNQYADQEIDYLTPTIYSAIFQLLQAKRSSYAITTSVLKYYEELFLQKKTYATLRFIEGLVDIFGYAMNNMPHEMPFSRMLAITNKIINLRVNLMKEELATKINKDS